MNIDKAGSKDMAAAVDDLLRNILRDLADSADASALNCDVPHLGIAAASVHDVYFTDERIAERHTIFLQETFNSVRCFDISGACFVIFLR
jgi:hypothetical protein